MCHGGIGLLASVWIIQNRVSDVSLVTSRPTDSTLEALATICYMSLRFTLHRSALYCL